MGKIFSKRQIKLVLSMILCICFFVLTGQGIFKKGAFASASDSYEVSNLRVNGNPHPLGIDTTPYFSWQINASGFARAQSAYRIIVADSLNKINAGEGNMWDSGKVNSTRFTDIKYEGSALEIRSTYYWRVSSWDESGKESGFGEVGIFETGYFENSDFTADWITSDFPKEYVFTNSKWIWPTASSSPNAGNDRDAITSYVRKSFNVDTSKTISRMAIVFTADDYCDIFLNGEKVGGSPNAADSWGTGKIIIIPSADVKNQNVIAVAITNSSRGYAGFLAIISIEYLDGSSVIINTDETWKGSESLTSGWSDTDFNDSSWQTVEQYVTFGGSPWGTGVSKPGGRAAKIFRKEFAVTKTITQAKAYISGLGFFELSINGELADDTVLNPANTMYNKTVPYCVFDVTRLLKNGQNAISVEVGHGFFDETNGVWKWNSAPWRAQPQLLMELYIVYSDGSSSFVKTDTTWKVSMDGPVAANSIYSGETIDARLVMDGVAEVGFDDSSWANAIATGYPTDTTIANAPDAKLVWQNYEPMRKVASYKPEVKRLSGGEYVIKAPRNMTGWAKIDFKNATAGAQLDLLYGEILGNDGRVNQTAYIRQEDYYICRGGSVETYEPKFSYKGFQFIMVTGFDGVLTADDVTLYVINNDIEKISTFKTSNSMINELHTLMVDTLQNNFQLKPTDTPMIEKNGWLGDINSALDSMKYNYDLANFIQRFLYDVRDTQLENGNIANLVPNASNVATGETFHHDGQDPVWTTTYINMVDYLYNTFGRASVVEEFYDSLSKLMDRYINVITQNEGNRGFIGSGLADWVSPSGGTNPDVGYPSEVANEGGRIVGTAYVYEAFQKMSAFAEMLNKPTDKAKFDGWIDEISSKFDTNFYKSDTGIYDTGEFSNNGPNRSRYRQTSNLVPIAKGLAKEENIDTVMTNLVADIQEKGYHLDTGSIGTKEILPVLTEYGYTDVAYKVLTQTTYPSWGHWLGKGATSLWEMWENTSRSRNHYFLGTYDEYFFEYMGGIRNDKNTYETFDLYPHIIPELEFVDISVKTARGEIVTSYKYNDSGYLEWTVTIPFGATANVYFPSSNVNNIMLGNAKISESMDGIQSISTSDPSGRVMAVLKSGSYNFVTGVDSDGVGAKRLDSLIERSDRLVNMTGGYDYSALSDFNSVLLSVKVSMAQETSDIKLNALYIKLYNAVNKLIEYNMHPNLALNKFAIQSSDVLSVLEATSYSVNNLTDGNPATGFISQGADGSLHSRFVTIDLGENFVIDTIKLYNFSLDGKQFMPPNVEILTSQGGGEFVSSGTFSISGAAFEVEIKPVMARFVRVKSSFEGSVGADARIGYGEIQIFNSKKANREQLIKRYNKLKDTNLSGFSAETTNVFRQKLENAKKLLDEGYLRYTEQIKVSLALNELNAAYDALTPEPEEIKKGCGSVTLGDSGGTTGLLAACLAITSITSIALFKRNIKLHCVS